MLSRSSHSLFQLVKQKLVLQLFLLGHLYRLIIMGSVYFTPCIHFWFISFTVLSFANFICFRQVSYKKYNCKTNVINVQVFYSYKLFKYIVHKLSRTLHTKPIINQLILDQNSHVFKS